MQHRPIQEISFPTDSGRPMGGWLCLPEPREAKAPGVIVIHEIYGMLDNLKPVLRRFAESGYAAFAPNLYDKPGPTSLCVARTMLAMASGRGDAVRDLESAKEFLKSHPAVDGGRLAAAGFCMGGGFALVMGLASDIKASAPYYGGSPGFLREVEKSCPVVGGFAGKDALTRAQAPLLDRALTRAGIPHDIKTYPDAGHAYMTEDAPGILHKLSRSWPLKVAYKPDDAEDSWKRMLGFFEQHV